MSELGDRFNKGKLRWRNVPLFLLKPLIEVGQFGESKYSTFNFLKCFPVLDSLDSLKRHLEQFENPYVSDLDSESLKNHLAHVAWNALLIIHTLEHHPDLDDRWKPCQEKEKTEVVKNDIKASSEVSKKRLDSLPETSQEQTNLPPESSLTMTPVPVNQNPSLLMSEVYMSLHPVPIVYTGTLKLEY